MRANRKADLQRKLTLASIPKPPAGLAERIKTDIPKHLVVDTDADRRRLRSAVSFNMRVAASLLLLIGSLFFALHLLNRAYVEEEHRVGEFDQALKTNQAPSPTVSPLPQLQRNAPQVVTSTLEPPAMVAPPKLRAKQLPQVAEVKDQRQEGERRDREPKKDEKIEGFANGPTSLGYLDKTTVTAPAPALPKPATSVAEASAPPLPPSPVPPPPAAPQVAAEATRESGLNADESLKAMRKAASPAGFVGSAQAADLAIGSPKGIFGYSIAANRSLDTTVSLVQHFSPPESRPKRGVHLEADAAPSPFNPAKDILRLSIDAAKNNGSPGSSPAPLAADARLEVDFNPEAVASHRAVTGEPASSEPALFEGTSMTALYELELRPSLARHTRVATLRLHYRSLADGRERTIERELRVNDLARSWDAAPRRTKGASLAAALGETRANGGDPSAIAGKARAIGLPELAELAEKR